MYFLKVVVNYVNELNPFFLQEFGGPPPQKNPGFQKKLLKHVLVNNFLYPKKPTKKAKFGLRLYVVDTMFCMFHIITSLLQDVHAFALAVMGPHVYWTDQRHNALLRADKKTGEHRHVLEKDLERPMEVVSLSRGKIPGKVIWPCIYHRA
jgi:hypothetical protein